VGYILGAPVIPALLVVLAVQELTIFSIHCISTGPLVRNLALCVLWTMVAVMLDMAGVGDRVFLTTSGRKVSL
jgi:hypothetical protein